MLERGEEGGEQLRRAWVGECRSRVLAGSSGSGAGSEREVGRGQRLQARGHEHCAGGQAALRAREPAGFQQRAGGDGFGERVAEVEGVHELEARGVGEREAVFGVVGEDGEGERGAGELFAAACVTVSSARS